MCPSYGPHSQHSSAEKPESGWIDAGLSNKASSPVSTKVAPQHQSRLPAAFKSLKNTNVKI